MSSGRAPAPGAHSERGSGTRHLCFLLFAREPDAKIGHVQEHHHQPARRRHAGAPLHVDLFTRRRLDVERAGEQGIEHPNVPGTYAEKPEIAALAATAGQAGGLYATHMRNEGTALEAAVKEALDIGEAARCPVEISHLKVDAPSRWGASAKALALIDAARARGRKVNADVYLDDAASATLGIRFPSWVLEGGQDRINDRLDDEAAWTRIKEEMKQLIRERGLEDYSFARIASHRSDPALNGLSIPAAALGRYVRERRTVSLEEAVRKMTSLPAEHFAFRDRGRIAVGQAADVVVLDAARVMDRATYERPHQYPEGIAVVLVNGVPVVKDGAHTGARPGRVLRHVK